MLSINNKFPFVVGVGYIMFIAGMAYGTVGDVPTCRTDPSTWVDVLNITMTLVTIFLLGLLVNIRSGYHED